MNEATEKDKGLECTNLADDSVLVEDAVTRLFNKLLSEVLDVMSSRFPHVKGDGSMNEVEFLGLRSKVLRLGNNKIREIPEITKDFLIVKTHDTIVERYEIKNKKPLANID